MGILGIDIGGTKTIVGVADKQGHVIASKRIDTPGSMGPTRALSAIKAAASEVIDQAGARIESIGIACGGPLDRKTGVLDAVPNLPGWKGTCVTKVFSDEFRVPAYLDNDSTAAALGACRAALSLRGQRMPGISGVGDGDSEVRARGPCRRARQSPLAVSIFTRRGNRRTGGKGYRRRRRVRLGDMV